MSARAPQDLPLVSETIRILNALLELDRAGLSAVMLSRHKVNDALADAPGVQCTKDGTLGALGLLQVLYPSMPDGRGAITAIAEGDTILRFEPTMATGGIVPGGPVICGGGDGPGQSLDIPVHVNLPPPESMNGWADQFPGSDFPDSKPNPG